MIAKNGHIRDLVLDEQLRVFEYSLGELEIVLWDEFSFDSHTVWASGALSPLT